MPFFFLAPIWLLCVLIGLVTLASGRFRFLASYLILGSTFGLVASFVLSTVALLLVPRFLAMIRYDGSLGGIVVVVGYVVGLVAGGFVGIVGGGLTAYRLPRASGRARRDRAPIRTHQCAQRSRFRIDSFWCGAWRSAVTRCRYFIVVLTSVWPRIFERRTTSPPCFRYSVAAVCRSR
jgi:hypothetical protein